MVGKYRVVRTNGCVKRGGKKIVRERGKWKGGKGVIEENVRA